MPDQTTPSPAAQALRLLRIPANLPAATLLALLREQKGARYVAKPTADERRPLTAFLFEGKWGIERIVGDDWTIVATGLNEDEAKARAERLNAGDKATGFHLWN